MGQEGNAEREKGQESVGFLIFITALCDSNKVDAIPDNAALNGGANLRKKNWLLGEG